MFGTAWMRLIRDAKQLRDHNILAWSIRRAELEQKVGESAVGTGGISTTRRGSSADSDATRVVGSLMPRLWAGPVGKERIRRLAGIGNWELSGASCFDSSSPCLASLSSPFFLSFSLSLSPSPRPDLPSGLRAPLVTLSTPTLSRLLLPHPQIPFTPIPTRHSPSNSSSSTYLHS